MDSSFGFVVFADGSRHRLHFFVIFASAGVPDSISGFFFFDSPHRAASFLLTHFLGNHFFITLFTLV